jgi:GR25 family glycosyltransferase involved in LPS biosynthesis
VIDHLKPITDKSGSHSMRNIDFIYMINLDGRPEKYENSLNQLEPYDIIPYRFSAVNGWELSFETLNNVGVKYQPWMDRSGWGTCYFPENNGEPHHEPVRVVGRNYFCHCMSRGAIGICLSHLSVLKDAYDSGYETIWVMEDDIEVIQDPNLISDLTEQLDRKVGKKGWDLLFTDQDTKDQQGNYVPCGAYAWRPNHVPNNPRRLTQKKKISPLFRKIGSRYGSYSYIIRRSGIKKILDFITTYQIFLPYDMDFIFPDDIKIFTVLDDVVSTRPQALSDNGSPGYLNK